MSISKVIFFIIISVLTLGAFGCGDPAATPNKNANSNAPIKTAANNNADNSFGGVKQGPGETTNQAPSIGPLMQTYYDALKKKDEAGLRDRKSVV